MSGDQDGYEWENVPSGNWPTRVVPDKGPLNGCVRVWYLLQLQLEVDSKLAGEYLHREHVLVCT